MKEGYIDLQTPKDVFDQLDKEFSFTLDAAATERSAKCRKFYTPELDGLAHSWEGERVFCHPPADSVAQWARKCAEEGAKRGTLVVLLSVARTDAAYFHDYILGKSEIRYLQKRMVCIDAATGKESRPSAGSMVAIYRGPLEGNLKTEIMWLLKGSVMTAGEVHHQLCRSGYHAKINGVTSRLSELRSERRIVPVGRRVCKITGRPANAWAAVEG